MWYTRSRRKKKLITISIIVLIIIFLSVVTLVNMQFQKVLTTKGFVEMRVEKITQTNENAIVQLKGGCSQLDIYITQWQGLAIEEGVHGTKSYRPSTHDIIVDILEDFGIQPLLVKITKLENNTYFAELYLSSWNRMLILDTRPSDAIAIAVRTNTPIYVNENLLTKTC